MRSSATQGIAMCGIDISITLLAITVDVVIFDEDKLCYTFINMSYNLVYFQ